MLFLKKYYIKVNRQDQADLLNGHTALSLILKACKELPNQSHLYADVSVKVGLRSGKKPNIWVTQLAACHRDYPFHHDIDVDAETDMLLTGPREDISYKYFKLRRLTLMYAPHVFENDSPVLLLVLALQTTKTVTNLLEHAGVVLHEDLDVRAARLLDSYQRKHGGTRWAEAFDGIRETMKGRWNSRNIGDYKGHA